MPDETQQQLIARATEGDAAAVRVLVNLLAPIIQRTVARVLLRGGSGGGRGIQVDVEDSTQDVLVALLAHRGKTLRSWSPERGLKLESFVALVARRHVLSTLRSRARSPYSASPTSPEELDRAPPASAPEPHRAAEARQTLLRVAEELEARLSPTGLDLFYRLYVREEKLEDVCEKTGLSAEAIYQWRTRIRKAARRARDSLTPSTEASDRRPASRSQPTQLRGSTPAVGRRNP